MLHRTLLPALLAAALSAPVLSAPVLSAPVLSAASVAPPAAAPLVRVVVQATDSAAQAAAAVRRAGGTVRADLPIVDGVSASVPVNALRALGAAPGVRAVTPDAAVQVQGSTTDASGRQSVYPREVGASTLHAAGATGKRVRVALVDTGVTPGTDLAGRVVPVDDPAQDPLLGSGEQVECANFSGEPGCADSYGHGTFLAGLIAGDGSASAGRYTGVAPGAEIVSVKIAGRDGSADVTKVLAAIQWVVSFKDTYDISVLNLSLGTSSTAPVELDPLNHAVERAWAAGIVVVVAASNRGPDAATISKPADDPLVLTVGAVDDRGTPAVSDDRSPAFTGRGPTAHGRAKPDVVAPGVRLVSLRSPGSFVEEHAGGTGVDATYRRGSGSSMSAAVVSGVVALVREARPEWTPDQVKSALVATAHGVISTDPSVVGAGLVQAPEAAAYGGPFVDQGAPTAAGGGSLDASRADVLVEQAGCLLDCLPRLGETTEQGLAFLSSDFTGNSWYGNSWYSSQWVGLTGNSWYGNSWYGNSWYGNSWYGTDDPDGSDPEPLGVPLPGSAWYGVYE
jgi:subtilisin family serine protease